MYTRNKVNLTITTILLVSALIIMLAPFYFIVVNSFKPLSEIAANGFALPKHFSLENYFVAWNRIDFGNALKNTTIITLLANVGPILSVLWQDIGSRVILTKSRNLFICL